MLILLAFLVTAVYSAFQIVLMEQGIKFGGFQSKFLNNTFILSIPITVNNTGYYDIANFNITSKLSDLNGTILARNSTFIEKITKGSTQQRLHNFSLSLVDILSNMTYLLYNDTEFKLDLSIGLRYAYALDFHLTAMNISMPWGAPLYGFNLREVRMSTFNGTHLIMRIFLELENHSFFDISGNLNLKVYNETGGYVGSGKGLVNVPSNSRFTSPIEVAIEVKNPFDLTGKGSVEVYFELPMVNYTLELGRFSYG